MKKLLALLLLALGCGQVQAQQVTPAPAPMALVCAYNGSAPTIATGNFAYVQCDSQGRFIASPSAAGLGAAIYSASVNAPGTGAVPGDIVTPTGGTTATLAGYLATARISISDTQVVSAAVAAGGSGCTNSLSATVTGTTGTGTKFQALVTVAGNTITQINSISVVGDYTANPTLITAEPVTGDSCTGAQLSVVMGALYLYIQQSGSYSMLPSLTANPQATTTGGGAGLTMNLKPLPLAVFAPQPQPGSTAVTAIQENTVYGVQAGGSITTGAENTYFGWHAGALNLAGGFNAAFGDGPMALMTAGGNNVAFGTDTLRNWISGSNNVALGYGALHFGACASGCNGSTAVGFDSQANWSATGPITTRNTSLGAQAAQGASGNASFLSVTAAGYTAGIALTSGSSNSLYGDRAGATVTSGASNAIFGAQCGGTTLTTGAGNILIGAGANTNCDTAASGTNDTFAIWGRSGSSPAISATTITTTPSWTINGAIALPGIANSAGNEILCYDTTGGPVTYESAVAGCVPSAMRFKLPRGAIEPRTALAKLTSLTTPVYTYKDTAKFGGQEYVGLYADQVCAVDERLCERGVDGQVKNYDKVGMLAYLVAAVQQQQREIEAMKSRWCLGRWCW